jgi:hypothetical protein
LVASSGTVAAPDPDSAIRQAIKDYGITDREQQRRLTAYLKGASGIA